MILMQQRISLKICNQGGGLLILNFEGKKVNTHHRLPWEKVEPIVEERLGRLLPNRGSG